MPKIKLTRGEWDSVLILIQGGIEYGYQDYGKLYEEIEKQLDSQEH